MCRYYTIGAGTNAVEQMGESTQGYIVAQLLTLLAECGFRDATTHPSLAGEEGMLVLIAQHA